jgi:hypothetical protein
VPKAHAKGRETPHRGRLRGATSCPAPPGAALADSGFFFVANLELMEQQNIDGYVPESNLACELNLGVRCRLKAQAAYVWRKAVVEPVFGVLKQQRGMRQFRTRG